MAGRCRPVELSRADGISPTTTDAAAAAQWVFIPFRRRRRRPFKQSEKWFQARAERAQNLSDSDGRSDLQICRCFLVKWEGVEGAIDTISIMSQNKAEPSRKHEDKARFAFQNEWRERQLETAVSPLLPEFSLQCLWDCI